MTHFVSPYAVLCLVPWLWRHRMGGEGRMFFLLGLVTASCRAMKSQRNLVDKHLWASREEILFLLPSGKRQDSANVLYPLLLLNPCYPLPLISFCTVSPYLDRGDWDLSLVCLYGGAPKEPSPPVTLPSPDRISLLVKSKLFTAE